MAPRLAWFFFMMVEYFAAMVALTRRLLGLQSVAALGLAPLTIWLPMKCSGCPAIPSGCSTIRACSSRAARTIWLFAPHGSRLFRDPRASLPAGQPGGAAAGWRRLRWRAISWS